MSTVSSTHNASLGRSLRASLAAIWDRFGLVIAVSLTWTFLLTLVLTVGRFVAHPVVARNVAALLVALALLPAPAGGAYALMHLVCAGDEFSYLDLWRGAKRLALPATLLTLLSGLVCAVFVVNVWFYLNVRSPIGGIAALMCGYAVIFWLMMAVYHFPLLAAQEAGVFDEPERRAQRGIIAILRRAFYLALGAPFYTLGLVASVVLPSILMFLTAVPFALFWMGSVALLTTVCTRALLVQFGVLPSPVTEPVIPDEQFRVKTKANMARSTEGEAD